MIQVDESEYPLRHRELDGLSVERAIADADKGQDHRHFNRDGQNAQDSANGPTSKV